MRRLLAFVAAAALLVPMAAAAQPVPEPITLDELERLALEHHPSLAAARAAVDAARGDARQAGAWPNPTVGYEVEDVRARPGQPRGEQTIVVEQTIPLGGRLRLSRQALEQGIVAAEADATFARQALVNRVRAAYYRTLAAQLRVDVRERLARLATEAVQVSSQLFNVGAADRPDVLASEIENEQLRVELVQARNELARAWRQLAIAVGQPGLPPRPVDGTLDAALPELARDATLSTILEGHPELAALRAEIARAELTLARARREPVPDLTLRAGPRYVRKHWEHTPEPIGWDWVAGAAVTVPLFNRNQGGVAAATADLARRQARLEQRRLEIHARFEDVFETYMSGLRMAERYRDAVLPKANEAYTLYLARYREMAAAYPQVLITQRALFEATERYLQQVESVWRASTALTGLLVGDEGLEGRE